MSSSVVVVTNTSDAMNGNVSSVAALNARPGRDGISLREALEAADHTRGSQTVYIMFSHALNGRTIEIRSELPPIHRSHLVLEGIAASGLPASVTIDGSRAPSATTDELLLVQASEVTIRWLRFAGLHRGNPTGRMEAVVVRPGWEEGGFSSPGPRTIAGVQVTDDVFDNRGNTSPGANALIVGTIFGISAGANRRVSGVTIAHDSFLGYATDTALGIWADGSGTSIGAVTIERNSFYGDLYAIELSEGGNGPRQDGEQIVGNAIVGGGVPNAIGVSVNTTNATNATIAGTVIEGNTITGVDGTAINVDAEVFNPGMGSSASGDAVADTQIANNLIRAGQGTDVGIYISGGDLTAPSPSSVSGLAIENDTLVEDGTGSVLNLIPNGEGVSGNEITRVTVRNAILWDPNGTPITTGSQPVYNQAPDAVMNSLISGPGWAGTDGNINANPDFVNEPGGDYQLAAGSPAINAGTTVGAPAYDIDGASRRLPPDIGAFEYGAVPRPLLAVTVEQLGGSGTVTSSPGGINCGIACSARFDPATVLALTARPDKRSRFLGWQGACSGTRRCSIKLSVGKSVTARFGPK